MSIPPVSAPPIPSSSATLSPSGRFALRANWNTALLLMIGVFAARVIYLALLSPYELVGDEAYYWEQARHLDWCYNEKGAALPWMIAASCHLFGDREWAVRLPVALASLIAAWGIGRLAMEVADAGDQAQRERVGFFSVLIFCLLPAFQANAQICTQDGLLIALWVGLAALGLRIVRRWTTRQSGWREWMLLWLVLGLGFYVKQTVLLFLPSLAIYWMLDRCAPPPTRRWYVLQIVGVALFFLVITPMIVWNAHHGWPMLAHTVGHLSGRGDQVGEEVKGNPFTWFGSIVGGVVFAFGPAFIALAVWATVHAWRISRDDREGDPDRGRWRDRVWLACAAWPGAMFFVVLSIFKPTVPSWPLPHLVPLVPLVALLAVVEWPRYREKLAQRQAGEKKVDTPFHQLWIVMIWYGTIGWLIWSFPNVLLTPLTHLPRMGEKIAHPLARIGGHRAEANELQAVLDRIPSSASPDGRAPLIVTKYYMPAGLYAFYLPGHPTVTTAQKYLGRRAINFDHWPDTDLANPAMRGRTLLLVGQGVPWETALRFDRLEWLDPVTRKFALAINFQGPR